MIFESLDPLLHFPGRVTVSMLVEPVPPAPAYQTLHQERSSRYADRWYTGLIARSQQAALATGGRGRPASAGALPYGEGTGRLAGRPPLPPLPVLGGRPVGARRGRTGRRLVYHRVGRRWRNCNQNMLVLGDVGSGKSMFLNWAGWRWPRGDSRSTSATRSRKDTGHLRPGYRRFIFQLLLGLLDGKAELAIL